ncbi:MAG: GxxExxY protein [Gemmatimonadetes bacterium]|jgi:GxxExxY protein|nr:GxxExxY protein [Gemmatimonadota bacterium]
MRQKRQDLTASGELLEKELTGRIIGAFYETYNILDFGFLESVYKSALAYELRDRGLHVRREVPVRVHYKNYRVGWHRIDLLVEERVVIELKATALLAPTDRRQLTNYLRATRLDVGLLLHYGPEPEVHRLVSPRYYRELKRGDAQPAGGTN